MGDIELLAASPGLLALAAAVLALPVGSFLNVVVHRLPVMLMRRWQAECAELRGEPAPRHEPYDLARPRSRCPQCGHPIRARDNIPILSYLVLRGRCAHCGGRIPLRYPLLEALTALASALVAWRFGWSVQTAAALALTWALLALAFIDLEHQILPDPLTLPLLWFGLLLATGGVFVDLQSAVLGAVAGYLSLWLVYHLFRLATGKEGMGYGDFKLLAMLGAWLGWQMLPLIILLSSVVGAAAGIALMALGRHARGTPMPFGPFLAAAGWIALLWGDALVALYLGPTTL
ncbi:prepilin peptidase [Inmirania thermothiophila]|uniref:Prepilin leader peptidase/N-methyltransferase n=1 Tax=Inmirania thermothiophila TaxID=1750597 RepID=A0A3N1XSS8_9GAMM|nr:A24 family peptidase [Inmirania thermothiophila]ROR29699.1 type 4 prepilin peptidase 1 [Inmirania thermothiophila]